MPRWVITAVIVVVVGLLGAVVTYGQGKREADNAPQVGECAHKIASDQIETVDCSDRLADYRVTSRQEGSADGDSFCAKDPEATVIYEFDAQDHGVSLKSFVLCMVEH